MVRHLALIVTSVFIVSQAVASAVRPSMMVGVDGGGDAITNLEYKTTDAAQVSAGTDLFAALGIEVTTSPTFPSAFDFRLVAGLKYAGSSESNTNTNGGPQNYSVTWLRENIELMSFYRNAAHGIRIGLGVNYEFASWINDSAPNGATNSFMPTVAMVVEFDYLPTRDGRWGFGLRINNSTYQSANTRESFSGDGAGLVVFTR